MAKSSHRRAVSFRGPEDWHRLCWCWRLSVDLRIRGESFPILGLGMPELTVAFSCGSLRILARPLSFLSKLLRRQQVSHLFHSYGAVAGGLLCRRQLKLCYRCKVPTTKADSAAGLCWEPLRLLVPVLATSVALASNSLIRPLAR
jgi:hypothetical protein